MKLTSDVLLVGSDGYIGSNCTLKDVAKCDIKSGEDFLELPIEGYDTIIFLAAAAATIEQTVADYMYNEMLYDKLDAWIKQFPSTHVIFSSSAAVYGDTVAARPSRENDYLNPVSIYGRSKLAGEFRVREYNRHTVLRFGNVYGKLGGQRGHGVTEAFSDGTTVIYGDGGQIRDFVHILFIWTVIEAAVKFPALWRGVTNIGTGEGVTVNEWFDRWGEGEPQYLPERLGDIYFSTLDNTKMLARLEICK